MSKDELLAKKLEDVKNLLNLTLTTIDDETDEDVLIGRLFATIDLLTKNVKALINIDEFLELYGLFYDD